MQRSHIGRRNALRAMGAMGLSTLGACACPLPSLPIGEPFPADLSPGSLTVPEPYPHSAIAIDAHCHIFNAQDIPAAAFLRGPIANDADPLGLGKALIAAFAGIVGALADLITMSARQELLYLETLVSRARRKHAGDPRITQSELDEESARQRENFARAFAEHVTPEFKALYDVQLNAWRAQRSRLLQQPSPGPVTTDFSPAGVKSILLEIEQISIRSHDPELQLFWLNLRQSGEQAEGHPGNLVEFVRKATSPRFVNLNQLQQIYRGGRDSPGIDLFCPSMLDFDYWLGCACKSPTTQDDGIRLMEQIAIATGGAILPLVGFNPRADVEQKGAAFRRVCDAVENRGFIGVKLYPPMGFLPYGNTGSVTQPLCPKLPDASHIEAALGKLYAWAREFNVPIMAHTSHSIGSTSAVEECAGPEGWMAAFEKFPGLRVQAGHFAGDSAAAIHAGWPDKFADIMNSDAGRNLHADLANMSDLFTDPQLIDLFERLLKRPLGDNTIVAERLLYGSDYFMTDMHGATPTFAKEMYKFIAKLEGRNPRALSNLTVNVFGLNAVRFYGVARTESTDGTETNRQRLERFYRDHHVPKPKWMCKVDNLAC